MASSGRSLVEQGRYVVGQDGGAFPASGASMRVNPATGNGVVLTASGGRGVTVLDWVYWETGKLTFEARRQVAQRRIVPASITIVIGAIAIVLWRRRK